MIIKTRIILTAHFKYFRCILPLETHAHQRKANKASHTKNNQPTPAAIVFTPFQT